MVGIHKCLQESHGWENPISSPAENWRDYSKNTIPLIKLLTLFHGMWERLQGFLCLSNWCWVVSNIWEGVERRKEMHIAKISGLVCVVGGLVITTEIHTHSHLFLEKCELLTQPRASLLPSVYCHDGPYAQTLTASETFHRLSFF